MPSMWRSRASASRRRSRLAALYAARKANSWRSQRWTVERSTPAALADVMIEVPVIRRSSARCCVALRARPSRGGVVFRLIPWRFLESNLGRGSPGTSREGFLAGDSRLWGDFDAPAQRIDCRQPLGEPVPTRRALERRANALAFSYIRMRLRPTAGPTSPSGGRPWNRMSAG